MVKSTNPLFWAKAFYFCFYAAGAALMPFLVLYYESLGLTGRQIGFLAGISPLIALVGGPLWGALADMTNRHKLIWIILMTLPFWTSYLLRVFSWKIILGFNGVINSGLKGLGLIDEPIEFLLYSPSAVVLTLTHAWAAFAILPIYV